MSLAVMQAGTLNLECNSLTIRLPDLLHYGIQVKCISYALHLSPYNSELAMAAGSRGIHLMLCYKFTN